MHKPPTVRLLNAIAWIGLVLQQIASAQTTGWLPQTSGTIQTLYTVKAVNESTAWTAGASGVVLRTTNYGATWVSAGSVGSDVYTITALDANTALVGSYSATLARIFKTTNGGSTWARVDSVAGGFYDHIYMFDQARGYLIGDPAPAGGNWILKRTTNGGINWFTASPLPAANSLEAGWNNSAQWLDTTYGWFGTNNNRIYWTSNGGSTWQSSSVSGTALRFNGVTTGIANASTGSISRSSDAGATWYQVPSTGGTSFGAFAGELGSQRFWGVAGSNIYHSSDWGANWTTDWPHGYVGTSALYHIDVAMTESGRLCGWAVGSGGTILIYRPSIPDSRSIEPELPNELSLSQNYPNPFNPSTTFQFTIDRRQLTILQVFDLLGREVATPINDVLEPGTHSIQWHPEGLASGVYMYRLTSGSLTTMKKMILLR